MSSQDGPLFQKRTLAVLLAIGIIVSMVPAISGEICPDQNPTGNGKAPGGEKDNSGSSDLSSVTKKRKQRQLRWALAFNTKDAKDYAKQLRDLGAILAVPENENKENRQFRVFRNLKDLPVNGEIEDLTKVRLIFWVDDDKKSVESLSKVLGLNKPPEFIIAFLPAKFEEELYEKEKKFQNRKEEEIDRTKFKIVWKDGKYEVQVAEQTLKSR
jgi:hypothetical protein